MIELATIQLNLYGSGNDVGYFVKDIRDYTQRTGDASTGSVITFRDGRQIEVTETVTAIQTAIAALWTAYLTAIGDPT